MSTEIKDKLSQRVPYMVKPIQCDKIQKLVREFELSPIRSDALYTATLAVHRAKFMRTDKELLFSIFETTLDEFAEHLKDISSIDMSRGVSGNPFNIFCVWIVHRIHHSSLNAKEKEQTIFALYKYMLFSFFTSSSAVLFKHGVNAELMAYTVETLSAKYDIKASETWLAEIESIIQDTRVRGSLWDKHEKSFTPDIQALNLIVYVQNNLRKKMIRLANAYYENHKRGKDVATSTLINDMGDNPEIKDIEAFVPDMVQHVINLATTHDAFIDVELIEMLVKMLKGVNGSRLITFFNAFTDIAAAQKASGKDREVKGKGDKKILIGYKELIGEIIQTSYKEASRSATGDVSRVSLILKTQTIYSASRTADPFILSVKNSATLLTEQILKTKREATITTYRTAFLLYIVMLTFKK